MKTSVIWLSVAAAMAFAAPASAEGDVKAGKKVFKKCKACHTVKEGKNGVGPSLYKVMDRPSGSVEDFTYSKPMADAALVWDNETMTAFLTNPNEVVPGSNMSFAGLKKQKQIDDLIAYLRDVSQD